MKGIILVTGGTGYIGSHTTVELIQAGYQVISIDNLSNSNIEVLDGIEAITGIRPIFYEADCNDEAVIEHIFKTHPGIQGVIHFAASKAVGESVHKPLHYYKNNLLSLIVLLEAMQRHGTKGIVFSSSCTVYGQPEILPVTEEAPIQVALSPYGNTKQINEEILSDVVYAGVPYKVIRLRYFNPIGAHPSGKIGEQPNGIPNNLLPYVCQVAAGKLKQLAVFGNDYPTPDGTGVRDYIHVVDLAVGHLKAIEQKSQTAGTHIYNLGTGQGYSVLDIIHAFEAASGQTIPYAIHPRRAGDIATCYANPAKAQAELGWQAERNLHTMMQDAWRWQSQNPNGYDD